MTIALWVFYLVVCLWLASRPTDRGLLKGRSVGMVVLGQILIICGIVIWPLWLPPLAIRALIQGWRTGK